ncbi:MAG TPA: hypothetical protein PKN57_04470 [Saprospiraceae bacterium]|jgi:hypothetical protein|nr:hypothetical protein [Saprospiraceae bacterium]MBX7261271.1 hypothetical protein [Chitinophagales bacterium]HNC34375.1 hypothetical protein [Bacteroidia bacterium]HNG27820.1 hypothetical protein [Chitinophagales bacterium]HNN27307.1 hypothetical protein [Chitinophagales bacterium]
MNKFLILIFIIQIISCTDQDNIKSYSLNNSTDYNIKAILFDRFGKSDTTNINKNDFKIMYEEGPPYDDGPFGVFDSLKIIFEDFKVLTYIPLKSKSECIDSIKNPFCPYSNYSCKDNVCTFEIDNVEYLKAK